MAQVWNDDAEGSKMDLTVVIPNNFNAKTEFKFKIKGYLEEVLYHTSEEIEVTTTNNITFEQPEGKFFPEEDDQQLKESFEGPAEYNILLKSNVNSSNTEVVVSSFQLVEL